MVTKSWSEYYKDRINNIEYDNYFSIKYNLFLEQIRKFINCNEVNYIEEGCGIGSVIKHLPKSNLRSITLNDANPDMLDLCKNNLNYLNCKNNLNYIDISYNVRNILHDFEFPKNSIVVTHGVLEHFSHSELGTILDKYTNPNIIFQAHYVPLNVYEKPSFGDERLLPVDYWVIMFKPTMYIVSGGDLFMFKY